MHLTSRQLDILGLVATGQSDKQIALRLGVSRRTVRTHLEKLFAEYGLRSRAEAVALWLRHPGLPPEPRPAMGAVEAPYADLWAGQAQQLKAPHPIRASLPTTQATRGLAICLLTELGGSLQAKRAILDELCVPLDACIELVQGALQQLITEDAGVHLIPELMPTATIRQADGPRALGAALEVTAEPQLGLA